MANDNLFRRPFGTGEMFSGFHTLRAGRRPLIKMECGQSRLNRMFRADMRPYRRRTLNLRLGERRSDRSICSLAENIRAAEGALHRLLDNQVRIGPTSLRSLPRTLPLPRRPEGRTSIRTPRYRMPQGTFLAR